VVQAAGTDVVCPAVAADDPDAAADEMVDDTAQIRDGRIVDAVDATLQFLDARTLRSQLGLAHLRRLENRVHEVGADAVTQFGQPRTRELRVQVGRELQAEPELRVVLEERVGPRRPATLLFAHVMAYLRHVAISAVLLQHIIADHASLRHFFSDLKLKLGEMEWPYLPSVRLKQCLCLLMVLQNHQAESAQYAGCERSRAFSVSSLDFRRICFR